MTSNQFYHSLNVRFDNRVSRLIGLGFEQRYHDMFGAYFARRNQANPHRTDMVSANTVMSQCNRQYIDTLASLLVRG